MNTQVPARNKGEFFVSIIHQVNPLKANRRLSQGNGSSLMDFNLGGTMSGKWIWIALVLLLVVSMLKSCDVAWADEVNWDSLVASVIEVESGGRVNAESHAGAIGLMQITPICFKEFQLNVRDEIYYLDGSYEVEYLAPKYEFSDLYDGKINIEIGTWYLRRLRNHYGCKSVEEICAAYDGGITRLRRNDYNISKMPDETQTYVKRVMKFYKGE